MFSFTDSHQSGYASVSDLTEEAVAWHRAQYQQRHHFAPAQAAPATDEWVTIRPTGQPPVYRQETWVVQRPTWPVQNQQSTTQGRHARQAPTNRSAGTAGYDRPAQPAWNWA